ncbi:receptor-like kinase, partial [Trifolium medium]|nr:receptor-like kinase [Trifolium medium]
MAFFNCSSVRKRHLRNQDQTYQGSQDMINCPIYVSKSYDSVLKLDLVSCTKMFDVNASFMVSDLTDNLLSLT